MNQIKEINGVMLFDTYIKTLKRTARAFGITDEHLMLELEGELLEWIMLYAKTGLTYIPKKHEGCEMFNTILQITIDTIKEALYNSINNYCFKANRISVDEYWRISEPKAPYPNE